VSPLIQPGEPGGFGGYIYGSRLAGFSYLGGHPAAATYQIFGLIGHGAKNIDLWNYGRYPISTGEWSEYQTVYQPIADAIRLVGRTEKFLFPGGPRRGNVAIYLPGISNLWDLNSNGIFYQNEVQFLHYAPVHAGYTVDFVDDYDLAGGALEQRGYTTLYVTGLNVANDKNMIPQPSNSPLNPPPIPSPQDQIQSWVHNGGVLALTLGGGVADEYNSQTSIFDTVLGLNARVANRSTIIGDNYHAFDIAGTITITDPRFGGGTRYISKPIATTGGNSPLAPTTATTAATLSTESPPTTPAITVNSYGKGFGIAYAFFPGFHYQQSANWDVNAQTEPSQGTALPYGWGKVQRDLVIAPAKIACTPRLITLTQQDGKPQEMVEDCLLESDKGIAIVLLNWADTPAHVPITNLTITLNNSTTNVPVGSLISSAQGKIVTPKLTTTAQPPFTITLSQLGYVDVIMIDTGPHLVHTDIINLAGELSSFTTAVVTDVYPFHIVGGHLSISGQLPVTPYFQVLAAQITDNQIQHAVTLQWNTTDLGEYPLAITDLAETITGNNPLNGNPNETVSHITHLFLYAGSNLGVKLDNIFLDMTMIYSP
jgi:hypothetical protein